MLGQIQFENFKGLTEMPQKAASAWNAFEQEGLTGASYKPLLYVGEQTAKGTNYWFIAEQTLTTKTPVKKIITSIDTLGRKQPRTHKPVSVFNPTKREERAMDFS